MLLWAPDQLRSGEQVVGRSTEPGHAGMVDLIPVTVPELLRQLRGTVIPEPRRDKPHRDAWALWRRRHQYDAQQAHQRWHAYADETPR